ncbi:11362_t:CDS:2, partial [Dentiscutata heterogama]
MSSLFVLFCLIKTIIGNNKFVSGSTLYRIKDTEKAFREIIYKGFTGSSETLIKEFKSNFIILMIGQYVYNKNVKYVNYTYSISYFLDDLTIKAENFPYSYLLLIYFALAMTNSYQTNDENGWYNSLKENLKKTVILVIERFKISLYKKTPHIIVSDIEWNYAENNSKSQASSSSNNRKSKPCGDLDDQLELIEEKYAKIEAQSSKKRKFSNFTPQANPLKDNLSSTNFKDTVMQIRTSKPAAQENSTKPAMQENFTESAVQENFDEMIN